MKTMFVSGTDTEVGKTWISCQILRKLRKTGHRVGAWKPVCSGAVERGGRLIWEDVEQLAAAIGGDPRDPTLIDRVCSQRFTVPMAPNVAARLEGREVSDEMLMSGLDVWRDHADLLLIEGAGGLMSPASDGMLVAELVSRLGSPLLLVAANRLGTIHQTLATLEAAQSRGLIVAAVVLNEVADDVEPILSQANESELRRLIPPTPLFVTARDSEFPCDSPEAECAAWFQDQ
ncbi:MAG: dethiobiotin synthase [Planctomycetaceae bacterium]